MAVRSKEHELNRDSNLSLSEILLLAKMYVVQTTAEFRASSLERTAARLNPNSSLLGETKPGTEISVSRVQETLIKIASLIEKSRFAEHVDLSKDPQATQFLEGFSANMSDSEFIGYPQAFRGDAIWSNVMGGFPKDLGQIYLLLEKLSALAQEKTTFGVDPHFAEIAKKLTAKLFAQSKEDTSIHELPLTLDGKFKIGLQVA